MLDVGEPLPGLQNSAQRRPGDRPNRGIFLPLDRICNVITYSRTRSAHGLQLDNSACEVREMQARPSAINIKTPMAEELLAFNRRYRRRASVR